MLKCVKLKHGQVVPTADTRLPIDLRWQRFGQDELQNPAGEIYKLAKIYSGPTEALLAVLKVSRARWEMEINAGPTAQTAGPLPSRTCLAPVCRPARALCFGFCWARFFRLVCQLAPAKKVDAVFGGRCPSTHTYSFTPVCHSTQRLPTNLLIYVEKFKEVSERLANKLQ